MKRYGLVAIFTAILILGIVYGLPRISKKSSSSVSIPEKVLANKFGFLAGGEPENPFVGEVGAAWVRPHPGPFLWDAMQGSKSSEIDFMNTDAIVSTQQEQNYGILVTLWPFAQWDQLNHPNSKECQVSRTDEFLMQNDKKGRGDYLPLHRCNPTDWSAYQNWIKAVVERYDGDGNDDMPGLKIPIKYWEVMNEPDLSYGVEDSRLSFYKEDANVYGELLIKTSQAIRSADPQANILIAGAAGADERFLNFYRTVFENPETQTAFNIGNVHCISNDKGTQDFNVRAYKKLLTDFSIDKPIWVTEAEAFTGRSADENYSMTKGSTEGAIAAGAQRIFFTRYNFDDFRKDMSVKNEVSLESINYSEQKYRKIIEQY